MTGRHSVFKIPSAKWFRPAQVREAATTGPRHARPVSPCWGCQCRLRCDLQTDYQKANR